MIKVLQKYKKGVYYMDRAEFDKLEVLEQIKVVNEALAKAESLRSISKSLSMSKTTLRDRFIKLGYKFNADIRKYIKDNNNREVQSYQSNTKVSPRANKQDIKPIDDGITKELQQYKNDLLELINAKAELMQMLKYHQSNTNVIDIPQIDINSIPQDLQKDIVLKSIKVYEPIFDRFNDICNKNKSIKKQDLLSLALYEFTQKYQ
jgi:hypothetical protein